MLFLAVLLSGAELKTAENGIAFGSAKLNIWDSGIMSLTDKQGLFTSWYFHFTTKHPGKWFSMSHKSCKLQKLPAENGTWKFKAAVPVTETETADAEMTLAATPFNTVEIECTWKCADPKNMLETGFFLSLPVKASEGGKMEILRKQDCRTVFERSGNIFLAHKKVQFLYEYHSGDSSSLPRPLHGRQNCPCHKQHSLL